MALIRIVVLNDGETFTAATGCAIYDVDDNATTDEIEEALRTIDRQGPAGPSDPPTALPIMRRVAWFDGMERMVVS